MENAGYLCNNRETLEKNESIASSNYGIRSTISQWLATFVNSLSFVSLGLLVTIPSVVIKDVSNVKTGLTLNDEQASWYASLLPIFQPVGCFAGGFLQSYIGRKHGLVLMNISAVTGWILLHRATNVEMFYVSSALMGISVGFSEAPGITYISEIATPRLRGTLVTYNISNAAFGITLTFLLAAFMHWRTLCLYCIGLSIFSVLLLVFIPDSPVWLLGKGKKEEAVKALCWLRGWVPEKCIEEEFAQLNKLMENTSDHQSTDKDSFWKRKLRIDKLLEEATWRPFVFLLCYMFFACAANIIGMRSYYLVIFDNLNLPVESTWLAFTTWLASLFGNIMCFCLVKVSGKRLLSLVSMTLCSLLSVLMGLYITFQRELNQPWIFVVLIILIGFAQCLGITTLPWVLLGEIYPVRVRSIVAGLTGATFYIVISMYVKSYYYLKMFTSVQGTFILYGLIGFVGLVYLQKCMPETEGKTMNEIETLFSSDARQSCPHFQVKK